MTRLLVCLLLAAAVAACSSTPAARQDAAADLIAARTLAAAAPSDGEQLAPWLVAERQRIEAERQAAGQRYAAAEKTCWQRFAVNACLRQARTERRATLDRLRQEDLALGEVERHHRTDARLRELEDKKSKAAPDVPNQAPE